MDNVLFSFLITILAGLSTLLGTFIIFLKIKNKTNIIVASLSFAASVMIFVSLIDLIPSSINLLNKTFQLFPAIVICFIFVVIGIIVSILIDKYLPEEIEQNNYQKLYRVGLISMVAIILHNLPEGIATFLTTNNNMTLGISLAIAIALHNIPEGISISVPIYYATNSRKKAIFYTFISSLAEPLGALIAYLFLAPYINDVIMSVIYSIIAGIMLHIAFYELLPNSLKQNKILISTIFILLGVGVMSLSHLLLG